MMNSLLLAENLSECSPIVARDRGLGWVDGLAHWTQGQTAFISVAFTWRLKEARDLAIGYREQGYHVLAGGPATFRPSGYLKDVAELGQQIPDVVTRHNPYATIASRGCPKDCSFCIVPALWGTEFTLLPDFIPRPILCDDNLSALPVEYQNHIIEKYTPRTVKLGKALSPLLDANSGFEPSSFDGGTYERWSKVLRGPWRFGYDELKEREQVRQMMTILRERGVRPRKMQVYCIIGNEPFEACMQRIREIHEWGGEPYCQRYMKLNALEKTPWVRHDWTLQKLSHVARWVARHLSKPVERGGVPFEKYNPSVKSRPRDKKQLELIA
jgi:hypothetical protein